MGFPIENPFEIFGYKIRPGIIFLIGFILVKMYFYIKGLKNKRPK